MMDEKSRKMESFQYSKALALASEKHAGQIRKDGTPYIFHLIRVSRMIAEAGYGINYQIAGLFHDLLEDTDTTEEEIEIYGKDILEATKLVSKNLCEDKNKYIENILNNHIASVVKNADRIDNLWDASYSDDLEFQKRYLKNSKENYAGKFSKALDSSIRRLEVKMSIEDLTEKRKYPEYDNESMELFSDANQRLLVEREERIKLLLEEYKDCEKPDKNNENLRYYEACGIYFCAYIMKEWPYASKVWELTEIGWVPKEINLFDIFEEDLEIVTHDCVLSEFFTRKKNNEILDFVTENDI